MGMRLTGRNKLWAYAPCASAVEVLLESRAGGAGSWERERKIEMANQLNIRLDKGEYVGGDTVYG